MVKLPLRATDAYANQHNLDDFNLLTDGNPATIYTVWNPPITPYVITYDLSDFSSYIVRQIKYLINNGNPSALKFYIERKDTKQKVLLLSYTGGVWIETMRTFDVPVNLQLNASKFIIENNGGNDFPADMELWGDSVLSTTPLPAAVKTPLKELVGVVTKPWDVDFYMYPEKRDNLKSLKISRTRLYGDWITNHQEDGSWILNGFNQVDSMKMLKQDNIAVQFCYQALPDNYPWPVADKNNPGSYLKLAQDVFYFCQQSKNNGDYFQIFELLNEQDAWYFPPNKWHDGYQLAAMCSVCYDGHKGQYPGVGLKASGSTALFSSGGVAEANPYLLYQMMEWSLANRGTRPDGTPDLPFDIYSFHCYNSLAGQFASNNPGGVPPEIGAAPYMARLNKIRRTYFPWLRIHVGEWSGGDLHQDSLLSATAFGNYSPSQVSSIWTVRDMLVMAENGMNASSYYRIKQDYDALEDTNSTQFATMALVRSESSGVKQPDGTYLGLQMHRVMTGDYMRQAADVLFNAGYVFVSRLSGSTENYVTAPHVLKFTNGTNDLYAIWQTETMDVDLNVSGDRPSFTERIGTYTLNVIGQLRKFVDDLSGTMTTQSFNGGTIQYSAKPVFVVTGAGTPPTEPTPSPEKTFISKGYFYDPKRVYFKHYRIGVGQYNTEFSTDYNWYKKST